MKKFSKILLCSTITTGILFSSMTNVFALSADQLYNNAYAATQTALSSGKQVDINTARDAIDALKGTGAAWATGQLSGQVDTVQQPILVKAITAITTAQNNQTQANVNAAKEAIDPELPQVWINAYSSAVDSVEQSIINSVVTAYNTANASKLPNDVRTALSKVEELLTSNDYTVYQYAQTLQSQINAIDDGSVKAGMYKVGTEVQPGDYIVVSNSTSSNDISGYVEITKDSTGSLDSIVMNNNVQGRVYITISSGQYLNIKDARMYPVGKAPSIIITNNQLPAGQYKVGVDIQPGEYTVHADSNDGFVEVDTDDSHNLENIVTNDNFSGDRYITVSEGQYITIERGYIKLK